MSWLQSPALLTLLLAILCAPGDAAAEGVPPEVDAVAGAQESVPTHDRAQDEPTNEPFGPGRVLVVPFARADVAEVLALQAGQAVATIVSQRAQGWSAITRDEIEDLLDIEQNQQLIGCASDAACLVDASRGIHPSWVVSGAIGMVGLSLTVTLTLIEAETAVVRNRVSEVILRNDALAADVRALTQRLFRWSQEREDEEPRFRLSAGRERSFAVFELTPSGVEESVADNLSEMLANELKKLEGSRVVSRDDIRNMLSLLGDKQRLGCAEDDACLAEIGGALGVSYLVAGTVGKIADTFIIALRLTNPQQGTVESRVTESFIGTGEQLLGAMRVAVWRLVGISRTGPGDLQLSANQPATVFLDGETIGTLPLGPLVGLPPGRHTLRLMADDFQEWQSDVYVEPGAETAVRAKLLPVPEEWYESWLFWTVAGGIAALAAGTTIAVVVATDANAGAQHATFPGMDVGLPAR